MDSNESDIEKEPLVGIKNEQESPHDDEINLKPQRQLSDREETRYYVTPFDVGFTNKRECEEETEI